jgi:hypothetical protein
VTISAVLIVRAQKERQKLSANVATPRVAATSPKFSCQFVDGLRDPATEASLKRN